MKPSRIRKGLALLLSALLLITLLPRTALPARAEEAFPEPPVLDEDSVYGQCGESAYWALENGVLWIFGEGNLYDYYSKFDDPDSFGVFYAPWNDYASQIHTVVIKSGISQMWNEDNFCFWFDSCSPSLYDFSGLHSIWIWNPTLDVPDLSSLNGLTSIYAYDSWAAQNSSFQSIFHSLDGAEEPADPLLPGEEPPVTDPVTPPVTEVSGVIGNISWTNDLENHVLTFSGEGAMPRRSDRINFWGDAEPSSEPYTVVFENGITYISEELFFENNDFGELITRVNFPESLTVIGGGAFAACRNLSILTDEVYGGVPAWSLTAVEASAFVNCSLPESFTLPESTVYLAGNAFYNCYNLYHLAICNPYCVIGPAMDDEETLANPSITELHGSAGSTTEAYALENGYAFSEENVWCSSYTGPSSGIYQGGEVTWTFDSSDGTLRFENIHYPNDETRIGQIPGFFVCYNEAYRMSVFPYYPSFAPWSLCVGAENIRHVEIGEGIDEIGGYAFYGLPNLESVTLPSTMKKIGEYAFGYNAKLTSFDFPEKLERIGPGAFVSCGLEHLLLPESVSKIGAEAFDGNYLRTVCIPNPDCVLENNCITRMVGSMLCYGREGSTLQAYCIPRYISFRVLPEDLSGMAEGLTPQSPEPTADGTLALSVDLGELSQAFSPQSVIVKKTAPDGTVTQQTVDLTGGSRSADGTLRLELLPYELGALFSLTVYGEKDGKSYCGRTVDVSMKDRLYALLKDGQTPAEQKRLYVDLLNYAAALQSYAGKYANNLVNKGLTAAMQALGTPETPPLTDCGALTRNEGASVSFRGYSLSVGTDYSLNFYLDLSAYAGDLNDLEIRLRCTAPDGTVRNEVLNRWMLDYVPFSDGVYCYRASLRGLDAASLRSVCEAEVYSLSTGDRISDSALCSAESYAAVRMNGSDEGSAALCDALMRFSDASAACTQAGDAAPVKALLASDEAAVELPGVDFEGKKTIAPFTDLSESQYWTDSVRWAYLSGITNGKTADRFAPKESCTRAQIITFLWRAAGQPASTIDLCFTDVKPGAYYANAVLWAVENGISVGTGDSRFRPNSICTRAEAVTFLWRYMGSPKPEAEDSPFTDVPANSYYSGAVRWAVEAGVTNGVSEFRFAPNSGCQRGQIVTFLYRCMVGAE